MGLQIGDIVSRREIDFAELKGKIIAIDAFNAIYQFLASIRQADGTPLMDSKRRITSHLSGLFYRNMALLSEGIKLIYVFDGEYSELKGKTHQIRGKVKEEMRQRYRVAKDEEDIEGMKRYSSGFMKLSDEIIEESKNFLDALGIGIVQASSEGEMQCAQLVKEESAYAVGSQDYDGLVVGGKKLIQNLTLARKRKVRNGFVYIAPELIEYEKVLNDLGIDGDMLICLAILVGSDFNPKGVRGIGPKKALTLVRSKKYPVEVFEELEEQGRLDFDWKDVFEIFKKPDVKKGVRVSFPKLNEDRVKKILVDEHEFSLDRVEKGLFRLKEIKRKSAQRTLF